MHDNLFNRCKSNIAAIEGSFAGAISIVPDWWDIPCTLKYSNPDEYYEALRLVLSGEIDIQAENEKSWEFIEYYLFLSKVNKLRVELIKTLL